jgi:hypothetical protein
MTEQYTPEQAAAQMFLQQQQNTAPSQPSYTDWLKSITCLPPLQLELQKLHYMELCTPHKALA